MPCLQHFQRAESFELCCFLCFPCCRRKQSSISSTTTMPPWSLNSLLKYLLELVAWVPVKWSSRWSNTRPSTREAAPNDEVPSRIDQIDCRQSTGDERSGEKAAFLVWCHEKKTKNWTVWAKIYALPYPASSLIRKRSFHHLFSSFFRRERRNSKF